MHLRPVYAAGNKRDKEKPAPLTNAEINRRQYSRIKANPEEYAIHLMKERHRMSVRNFVPRPDIASAWVPKRNASRSESQDNYLEVKA